MALCELAAIGGKKLLDEQIVFYQAPPAAPAKQVAFTFLEQRVCCTHGLNRAAGDQFLDLADGFSGLEALGAPIHAVHDGVAAEQTIGVFQIVQTLASSGIAAVGDEAVGLQQASGADELVGVPPERRAADRAAGAQDALVQTVELFALFGRLQALFVFS